MKRNLILAITLVLAIAQYGSADILSLYEFSVDGVEDASQNEISMTSDNHASSVATPYSTRSSAIGAVETGVSQGLHGFMSAMNTPDNIDPTVNGYFHEFTNTITAGEWSIDAITFDYWVNAAPVGGEFSVSVFSDRTGMNSASDVLGTFTYNTTGGNTGQQTISLNFPNNPNLQNLGAGDATTFRMVFSDNQTTGFMHRIDDVEIRGNPIIAVPEPASAILLGASMLGFALRRRRQS